MRADIESHGVRCQIVREQRVEYGTTCDLSGPHPVHEDFLEIASWTVIAHTPLCTHFRRENLGDSCTLVFTSEGRTDGPTHKEQKKSLVVFKKIQFST